MRSRVCLTQHHMGGSWEHPKVSLFLKSFPGFLVLVSLNGLCGNDRAVMVQ